MLVAVVLRRRGFQSLEIEGDPEVILSTHHCMVAGTEVRKGAMACPKIAPGSLAEPEMGVAVRWLPGWC